MGADLLTSCRELLQSLPSARLDLEDLACDLATCVRRHRFAPKSFAPTYKSVDAELGRLESTLKAAYEIAWRVNGLSCPVTLTVDGVIIQPGGPKHSDIVATARELMSLEGFDHICPWNMIETLTALYSATDRARKRLAATVPTSRHRNADRHESVRFIHALSRIFEGVTGMPGRPSDLGGGRRNDQPGPFTEFVQSAWKLSGAAEPPGLRAIQKALRTPHPKDQQNDR